MTTKKGPGPLGRQSAVALRVETIEEQLSRQTGVSEQDVKKILLALGIEGALWNRLARDGPDAIGRISLENIRIAAGPVADVAQ